MKQLTFFLSLLLCTPILAADPAANATAKFLAGLPLKGTILEGHATDPEWTAHADELDRAWERLEKEQISRIRAWVPEGLGAAYQDVGPMFYMFSGPDFLYAHVFFPNASTYILCGIEPIGGVPDIDSIPANLLPSVLANLRKSLNSLLGQSYFITKFMMADFKKTHLGGVLPVLYVFLARACLTIESITPVTLDRDGNLLAEGEGTTPGVKIVFTAPSGRKQTLYYFKSDLADKGVKAEPGFSKFCERQGRGVSLLKAAAYLMKSKNFSIIRTFLLDHSKIILQDDSGIPFEMLDSGKWDTRLYAKPDDESKPPRLQFSFGYEWKKTQTTLMVATPK